MPEKVYWTTKEGDRLDIDMMPVSHLRNIVKQVARWREEQKDNIPDHDEDDHYPDWLSPWDIF